jgi:hypothetical protein
MIHMKVISPCAFVSDHTSYERGQSGGFCGKLKDLTNNNVRLHACISTLTQYFRQYLNFPHR